MSFILSYDQIFQLKAACGQAVLNPLYFSINIFFIKGFKGISNKSMKNLSLHLILEYCFCYLVNRVYSFCAEKEITFFYYLSWDVWGSKVVLFKFHWLNIIAFFHPFCFLKGRSWSTLVEDPWAKKVLLYITAWFISFCISYNLIS